MLADDLAQALDPVTIFAKEALRFNPDPWQERGVKVERRLLLELFTAKR